MEMVSPTPVSEVPLSGDSAFTFDPATLILTASATIEQMDSTGLVGYDGMVNFLLNDGQSAFAFSINYKNCN